MFHCNWDQDLLFINRVTRSYEMEYPRSRLEGIKYSYTVTLAHARLCEPEEFLSLSLCQAFNTRRGLSVLRQARAQNHSTCVIVEYIFKKNKLNRRHILLSFTLQLGLNLLLNISSSLCTAFSTKILYAQGSQGKLHYEKILGPSIESVTLSMILLVYCFG